MPTTAIRWQCVQRYNELLQEHPQLVDVTVSPRPGDDTGPEFIWVQNIEGEMSIPTSKAGRLHRDDKFTITYWAQVALGDDLDTTMERTEELMGACGDVLADESQLDDLDGVLSAVLAAVNGPLIVETPAGFFGMAQLDVDVHTRLT